MAGPGSPHESLHDTGLPIPQIRVSHRKYFRECLDIRADRHIRSSDVHDTVAYTITAGNDAGKFAVDGGTGRLMVAGTEAFNLAQTPAYTLTVEASDGRGGKATASGTVVPQPAQNQPLVRDCSVLLTAKDTLRGTATLNWVPPHTRG